MFSLSSPLFRVVRAPPTKTTPWSAIWSIVVNLRHKNVDEALMLQPFQVPLVPVVNRAADHVSCQETSIREAARARHQLMKQHGLILDHLSEIRREVCRRDHGKASARVEVFGDFLQFSLRRLHVYHFAIELVNVIVLALESAPACIVRGNRCRNCVMGLGVEQATKLIIRLRSEIR